MIFTRKRSRNESRSFAAARASTSAEEQKEIYIRKFYSKKTNHYHVHFQLYVKLIEQQEKLLVSEHFEEDHAELFVILLLPKRKFWFFNIIKSKIK
jgi:hypothetical protein